MRIPEWIQLITVTLLTLAAPLRRLEHHRQLRVALLAMVAIATVSVAKVSEQLMSPHAASIVWDWLPGALMLIPYWQVGQFFTAPDPAVERRLSSVDRAFFDRLGIKPAGTRISPIISTYLEIVYFVVYLLVPLGVVALYTTESRKEVDFYWVVVLSATYVCYGSTLAIRARPPRMLLGYKGFSIPATPVRRVNRDILDHASIQAITCPSAHVASALAAALVIFHAHAFGLLFLWAALSIAVATVVGGYHYVADVLSAVFLAFVVFAIAYFM